MIVVDASVVVDMLLGSGSQAGDDLVRRLAGGETAAAPHLLDVEVGQVLRRFVLRSEISAALAQSLMDELSQLPLARYPHQGLVNRALELLNNVTVYDGIYLALAEALDCLLLTGDTALLDVPGCAAEVQVLRSGSA